MITSPPSPSPSPSYSPTPTLSGDSAIAFGATEVPDFGEAFRMTQTSNIPEAFCRYVYDDWSTRQGKDAAGQLIGWLPYVTKRWSREQVEWRNGKHKGCPKVDGEKHLSLYEMKQKMEAQERKAASIKNAYSSDAALGTNWSNEAKRKEWVELRRSISILNTQIANYT